MEKVDKLLLQVRTAHRLLAAYYQRLLPTISDMASQLDLSFYYWGNADFNLPTAARYDITACWQWDLLPGLNTSFIYGWFKNKDKVQVGEYLVEFMVVSDTAIDTKFQGHKSEPDALNLSPRVGDAESIIRITVCAPWKAFNENWYNAVWRGSAYPEFSDQPKAEKDTNDGYCFLTGFECPLSEVMSDEGVERVISRTKLYIESSVAAAKKESQLVVVT
ncbi:hypothetical protein [Vibrio algarum]|uniref:Uncharacterized protein n=1 Tax=Vibrio algarum TaxID=3020714 RepID=A0ABT4YUI4_9VIBR|nr:hypothetical protein [Vibrio sp. KJ40-1]MDB1124679.1 hypothetical protein [Vibrio sp. KJ40-1]